jgi:uncharacterized protein (TIRG00374 family)
MNIENPSLSVEDTTEGRSSETKRRWPRRVGMTLLALFVAVFVMQNRSELPGAWRAVRHAKLDMVALAACAMLLWLVNLALLHESAQRAAGLRTRPLSLVAPAAAGNFLNLVTKSGGMAGMATFLANGRRRGHGRGPVVAAYLLVAVLLEMAFAVVLIAALAVVWVDGRLTRSEVIASVVFSLYVAVRVTLLIVAMRSRATLRRLYQLPRRVIVRLRPNSKTRAPDDHRGADEMYDAMALIRERPKMAAVSLGHAVALEALGTFELWVVMISVGAGRSVVTALVAYAVSVLFTIVGVFPGGLGFVEVSLGAVLSSFGATTAKATAAVVLYRLFEMWIPAAIGGIAAHVLRRETTKA